MDGDAPEPGARHPFGGQADSADALPALEHRIVAKADCAEFQHVVAGFVHVSETHNAAERNMIAKQRCVSNWAMEFPQRQWVSKGRATVR